MTPRTRTAHRPKSVQGIKAVCPLNVRHKIIWLPSAADDRYVVAECDKCGVRAVCRTVTYRLTKARKRERSA